MTLLEIQYINADKVLTYVVVFIVAAFMIWFGVAFFFFVLETIVEILTELFCLFKRVFINLKNKIT